MIDLHTHTNYSDGVWNLKELLAEAKENKVEVLSITDHDTIDAYKELKENNYYKEIFKGKIIPGAEFNAFFENSKIELLGYKIDTDKIESWCNKTYKENPKYKLDLDNEFKILVNSCKKNNVKIDNIIYNKSIGWPIDVIRENIKKYPENKKLFKEIELNDKDLFYRNCTCNPKFPAYLDCSNSLPRAKEVSDTIRKANGLVFIAHIFVYSLEDHKKYLDKLREENIIDGIEVYYSKHTPEQIKFLEDYCKKYNLLISGGTDCHGNKEKGIHVGIGYGNMNIKKSQINWLINMEETWN